jgi:hypothetical protein
MLHELRSRVLPKHPLDGLRDKFTKERPKTRQEKAAEIAY